MGYDELAILHAEVERLQAEQRQKDVDRWLHLHSSWAAANERAEAAESRLAAAAALLERWMEGYGGTNQQHLKRRKDTSDFLDAQPAALPARKE